MSMDVAPTTSDELPTAGQVWAVCSNKYQRKIRGRYGSHAIVDVYDVLTAFGVHCPARQHALKKLLCAGQRGGKSALQDLGEVLMSVERAIELAGGESPLEALRKSVIADLAGVRAMHEVSRQAMLDTLELADEGQDLSYLVRQLITRLAMTELSKESSVEAADLSTAAAVEADTLSTAPAVEADKYDE